MRNLLGRLHSRRLPELLRIGDAWGVPLHGESKSEVVSALYRAMTDPRTVRDLWDRLSDAERAVALALADAPETSRAPTVAELAARLGVADDAARETALGLYRAGVLAREGDDEPLPIGAAPRLLMPREVALTVRRIQDEMAAGDLAQSPLRVLIELLDDSELEGAARTWGLRTLPGVARRQDVASRVLRLVNDRGRVERVVRGLGRDAAALWRVVRSADAPVALAEASSQAGFPGTDTATRARLRAALAELENALLVWHGYRADGTRWLFVPDEIRSPGDTPPAALPPLADVHLADHEHPAWRSPDAFAWDMITTLRIVSGKAAPVWDAADSAPRWLSRAAAHRLWFGGRDGAPAGYLELLRALALDEGVLMVDDQGRTPRIAPGPNARSWRDLGFSAQTGRLRERWLRLPRWVEGEPAGIVDIWGADWRGMRPRLLAALADAEIGLGAERWVTLEGLSARIAARFPALLGPSFMAATARLAGEAGAGASEEEARAAALGDVIAFELAGPFVWFGITRIVDRAGQPRAISLTARGAALAGRKPFADEGASAARAPLAVSESGEIALHTPSPHRVWALAAFAEPVDLGPVSHYRITQGSIATALTSGIEREQIVTFLERGSGGPLPHEVAANLEAWARARKRALFRRAVVIHLDGHARQGTLLAMLHDHGWQAEAAGEAIVVTLADEGAAATPEEERLQAAVRAAGFRPQWATGEGEDGMDAPDAPAGEDRGQPAGGAR